MSVCVSKSFIQFKKQTHKNAHILKTNILINLTIPHIKGFFNIRTTFKSQLTLRLILTKTKHQNIDQETKKQWSIFSITI